MVLLKLIQLQKQKLGVVFGFRHLTSVSHPFLTCGPFGNFITKPLTDAIIPALIMFYSNDRTGLKTEDHHISRDCCEPGIHSDPTVFVMDVVSLSFFLKLSFQHCCLYIRQDSGGMTGTDRQLINIPVRISSCTRSRANMGCAL